MISLRNTPSTRTNRQMREQRQRDQDLAKRNLRYALIEEWDNLLELETRTVKQARRVRELAQLLGY